MNAGEDLARILDELVDLLTSVTICLVVHPDDAENVRVTVAESRETLPYGVIVKIRESPLVERGQAITWLSSTATGEVIPL